MKKIFYLYLSGNLQRKDSSLVLIQKNGNVHYLPIEQIDAIICFSYVELNKTTLSLLNQYHITLIFFNYYGNYIGRFTPKVYQNGKVLLNQVICYQNEDTRLYIAKSIIIGSIKNMCSLAKYYQKKGKKLSEKIDALNICMQSIKDVSNVNELMLEEAKAKQFYYSIFDIILEFENFKFEKRMKHPPKNEVNALLSYGYALLYAVILSILDRSSLCPQISFIHSLSKNCDSLQFDIADIFKPVLVDRMVLRMIRKKQIQQKHFDYKVDGRCYLNQEGVKVFINVFNANLTSTILYNGKSYSYRSLLSKEVHKLSNYIKGISRDYKAFTMKW